MSHKPLGRALSIIAIALCFAYLVWQRPLLTVETSIPDDTAVLTIAPISTDWSPLPPPMHTSLPTVSADNNSHYASHNIAFAATTPVAIRLQTLEKFPYTHAAWSPDGEILATTLRNQVVLFDADGQALRILVEGAHPHWSPTGRYIAYRQWHEASQSGEVKIIDITTGEIAVVIAVPATMYWPYITWISDTELLFYLNELLVFDLVTGQSSPFLNDALAKELVAAEPTAEVYNVSSLPKHGLIAIDSGQSIIIFRQDPGGLNILRKIDEGADGDSVVFSPDGLTFAYVSMKTRQVRLGSLANDIIIELPSGGYSGTSLVWSPDGASLMYHDPAGVHIVNRDGSGYRLVAEAVGRYQMVAWSAQGIVALLSPDDPMLLLKPIMKIPTN